MAIIGGPTASRNPWGEIGESFSKGFSESFQKAGEEKKKTAQMLQENAQIKSQTGIDLSGVTDPKLRQTYVTAALQGANAKDLEKLKQEGKQNLTPLQQKQLELSEERLNALKGQQTRFKKLMNSGEQDFQGNNESEKNNIQNFKDNDLREAAAFKGQPGEAGIIGNIAQSELDRREKEIQNRTSKEKQYFKINEPKVMELASTERKLDVEAARFDRLNELFIDESKFPSPFTASLFTSEGQINDKAYSLLSPEAQEAVKLIIDSTANIKDTYGSRVTNFDLQTYLKKLPSLLNSPEGKTRVLRDLQIINQLNQMHASGIQEIFEEAGGTDKIPYSTAEQRYKKKYADKEKELLKFFVNPEKGTFNELPDASQFLGRKLKNPETGEIFISDGSTWKPFKG